MRQITRRAYRAGRILLSRFWGWIYTLRWRYTQPTLTSSYCEGAHVLVFKRNIYAKLAITSVLSFLHFHPKARVIIHCDEETRVETSQRFRREILLGKVSISSLPVDVKTWQDAKIAIFQKLIGTSDLFMDADLKWNSVLPRFEGIHFLVREFRFRDHPQFQWMFEEDEFGDLENVFMWNTSFFSFGGVSPSIDFLEVHSLRTKIVSKASARFADSELKGEISRISEQTSLSIVFSRCSSPIKGIKNTDGLKDGSFLESTYFGATGQTFF